MSASSRADRFVAQLAANLRTQLASSGAVTVAALRAQLGAVFTALPHADERAAALRTELLSRTDEYAAQLAKDIADAAATTDDDAAAAPSTLFRPSDFHAAILRAQDDSAQFLPLLLPSSRPAAVPLELLRTLIRQQESHPARSLLSQEHEMTLACLALGSAHSAEELVHSLELLVHLARALPLAHAAVFGLSGLIDRAQAQVASIAAFTPHQRRACQSNLARLLLEEARRSLFAPNANEETTRFVSRVRCALRRTGTSGFTGSLAGELMFLQHSLVALQEHKSVAKTSRAAAASAEEAPSTASKAKAKRGRSRSRSPAPRATPKFEVAFFTPAVYTAVFDAIFTDVALQLSTASRGEGDVESELLRFALVIRFVEHSASSDLSQLKQSALRVSSSFPALPLPLTLRATAAERLPGVTKVAALWSSQGVRASTLESMLRDFDGDVTLRSLNPEAEEEAETEEKESDKPASKNAKQAAAKFDALGSTSSSALFFIDGVGAASGDAAAAASSEEASATAAMTDILSAMPEAKPSKAKAKAKGKSKKAKVEEAEEQAEEEVISGDAAPMELEEEKSAKPEPEADEAETEQPATKAKPQKRKGKAAAAAVKKEEEAQAPAEVAVSTRAKRSKK